jgi:glycosyltransferase involved in cell wall biosynthesis
VDDAARNTLVGDARAAILPGEEDFGLVPLEAAAAGRPTIAYAAGGALETIVDGETGTFFRALTPAALADAIRTFDPARYDPARLRAHAEEFRPERFVARLRAIVDDTVAAR